jgi:putative ABC transport system permease protein
LLLLYVSYEWNYNKLQGADNHVYQVLINFTDLNGKITGTGTTTPNTIGPYLKQTYPGVEAMSRIDYGDNRLIANKTNSFKKRGRFADADLLNILNYDFISGDKKTALNIPNSVILTETTAKILFGTADALNKEVRFEDKIGLKVTGVIKDLPKNSSTYFDYLMPWTLFEELNDWMKLPMWTNNNWTTLVKVSPTADVRALNQSMKGIIQKNIKDATSEPFLFDFSKLHLYGTFAQGKSTGGAIEQLRLLMGLALGVLLIACINFMNMATAKSERRAKEVGIKKTIGATRSSLVRQFMLESLLSAACSSVIAIILVEACLPMFNNLLGIKIDISYSSPFLWMSLLGIVLLTGVIAGSYPAFYLSSFNPLQILKKKSPNKSFSISLRQILVVLQFSFAVILIIATTVIYQQIQYIKSRPIGFDLNQLIEIPQDGQLTDKFELLRERLLQSGAVTGVFQTSGSLSYSNSNFWGMEWKGSTEIERHYVFNQLATTYDFIKTSGVKLVEGRDFSRNFASDTAAILLSQSAVKRMGLLHPLGEVVKYQGENRAVIGIFKDFVWGSPLQSPPPMVVAFNKSWNGYINMRLNAASNAIANIATIENIIKGINPAYPPEIHFVDELYAEQLKSQKILSVLSNVFGGLAIFISCLGLFGLAAYSAEQRTKEIGVRKVLGASVSSLMQLLSVSFLKMVVIAIIIAIPVATYLMNNWLKEFEFHTSISWIVIAVTAISTIAIALFTVSFQAYKAVNANPVDALKYE